MAGNVLAGGSGANGRITAAGKDNFPLAELIATDTEAVIAAGQKGGRPGRFTLYDGAQNATINISSVDAHVVAGGNGANGRFTTRGKDGKPVVELIATDKESIVGLGQLGRPGRISVYDAKQKESVRIDGATGDVVLVNADCAEEFDLEGEAPPGSVVVLFGEERVSRSNTAYDTRVAGVVSGAGAYRPGIVLGRRDAGRRVPVALMGKAYCWVDASGGPVGVGDLLTTSARPGHAMRAADRRRLTGALLGKALRPLAAGTGLIPVLVTLQ